jgi:hypothetical protein
MHGDMVRFDSLLAPDPASRIAPGGFEPPFSDPKSDVLPLDEGAATSKATRSSEGRQHARVRAPVTSEHRTRAR